MLGLTARLAKALGGRRPARIRADAGRRLRRRLACEALEARELLSGLGSDYTLMGGQWDNSRPVSFSIAPDGVAWDLAPNNVNASLNAQFGGPGWQVNVARALQTWAVATNLDFVPSGDSFFEFNAAGVNQGDSKFGDIRVGGYDFSTTATIARTYGPPPNGQTGAGDVELNTGFNFGPASRYDLQTVLLHELGHSLGLGESPQPSSVMYAYYAGVHRSLSAYDIEGIQSLYGARQLDVYQRQGLATSPASALDLTPILNPAAQGQLAGLGLASIGSVEYFSVVAPQLSGATLRVAAIATGFSLLSPKVSVIDPTTGATLATDAHPDQFGNVALAGVAGVQAGHRYLIAVSGATGDEFAIGSYGVSLGFFGGTPLTPPPDPFAYNNTFATATNLGVNTQPTLGNLTLPYGSNYQVFTFQATRPGLVLVASLGANMIAVNSSGATLAHGSGLMGFYSASGANRYFLVLYSPNGASVANYAFAVRTPASSGNGAAAPARPGGSSTVSAASTTAPVAIPGVSTAAPMPGATTPAPSPEIGTGPAPTGLLRKPRPRI